MAACCAHQPITSDQGAYVVARASKKRVIERICPQYEKVLLQILLVEVKQNVYESRM